MNPIVVERKVDADGVLRLEIPVGAAEAGRCVRVSATLLPKPMTQEEWHRFVDEMAGSWQGDFEVLDDPPPADPEWMRTAYRSGSGSTGVDGTTSADRSHHPDRPGRSS